MRAARHRWVLAVDNDVVLEPGEAARLAEALEAHPQAAVAQPRSLHAGDPSRVHYDGAEIHCVGLLALRNFYRPIDQAAGRGVVEVGAFVALCALVDRDVLLSLGGYDPRYFILFEDLDLSLRLRQRGHRILSVEEALVRHGSGTPGTSFRAGVYPERRAFLHGRNRWHLLAKSWSCSTLVVLLPGLLPYECVEIAFALRAGNLLPFLRGRISFLGGLPATLAARRTVQHLRRVPDRELFVGGPLTLSPLVLASPPRRALARGLDRALRSWWSFVRPWCG
jgi:GT2 family glycosyltransferase